MSKPPLPDGVLVAFYGDDFTGSSAVMEVLTFAGVPTVMFLEPPGPEQLRRFAHCRAVGIAGVARSQTPEWMDRYLPQVFAGLEALGAGVTHYKVCSTLDSSPSLGSIGRAMDIGIPILAARPGAADWQPIVIGAPAIGRYQAFGTLFATFEGETYRLDRHPVMRRHPATPMDEADVRLHLERQTGRSIGLIDFAAIRSGTAADRFAAALADGQQALAIDVLDAETLAWAGRQMWEQRGAGLFAVGSQGVEYALVAHWQAAGLLPEASRAAPAGECDRIIAVSGSVSPVTAGQIAWAERHGFEVVPVDPCRATDDGAWAAELEGAIEGARKALSVGRSPLLATARGPDDPAVERFSALLKTAGADATAVNARIGAGLGGAVGRLMVETGLRRAVISGGDTSGHATKALGITALTALAPLMPGAPLCRAYADHGPLDGIELALKGGQMGAPDYFGSVRAGRAINAQEKSK